MGLRVDVRAARGPFSVAAAFTAELGQTIALLGPNGAGKSTLLAVLAGLLRPTSGTVVLEDQDLDDVDRGVHLSPRQRRVGVVFQDRLLFPHLTAAQNVAFPLEARGIARAEAMQQARVLLDTVGIADLAGARPAQLSGGEAQRVALARALITQPRLLLLDEPLSALDLQAKGRIRALLRGVRSQFGGVKLLVTHDAVDAMTLADKIVMMEGGKVTQQGTLADLRRRPATPYCAQLVGLNVFVGRLEPLDRGAGRLVTSDGEIVVGWPAGLGGATIDDVTAIVRPADVVLQLAMPQGGSARNVLAGRIAGLSLEGDRAVVQLDCHPPIMAEVTFGSVERLGLVEGLPVWATFKAVEVQVEP